MKDIVGLVENVTIRGTKTISTVAVFDTGAQRTSIDTILASQAGLGPITGVVKIKNASTKGRVTRPVVMATIDIHGKKFRVKVNIQDRSHMNFPMIIGRNILSGNFLVDPEKNEKKWKLKNLKNLG